MGRESTEMQFDFSNDPDYLRHAQEFLNDDYSSAIKSLNITLARAIDRKDREATAFLFKRIGEIWHFAGLDDRALEYFRKAEEADPEFLYCKYSIAEFAFEKMNNAKYAEELCVNIQDLIGRHMREPERAYVGKMNINDKVSALMSRLRRAL